MPVKRQVQTSTTMSRKTSSVVVMSQVTQSRSSMTSLKTVTHQRSDSGGRVMEAWSSPSLVLSSPQAWVSGTKATFPSPPKSPSPNRRFTRRSSVYVKQAGIGKAKLKPSPKKLEFKVPSSSAAMSSSRSRQSAVFQENSRESTTTRRSSVYRKTSKRQGAEAVMLEQEELEIQVSGSKNRKPSPKTKISKLPVASGKKSTSPLKVTRTGKRNVSEMEKEESSEKPAAKRMKRAGDESVTVASAKGKASAGTDTSSPAKANKKAAHKAKSPSPKKTRSVKSQQSASSKKTAKSPSHTKTRSGKSAESENLEEADESPLNLSLKKTKSKKSPKKTVKSPSAKRTRSARSAESEAPEDAVDSPLDLSFKKTVKSKKSSKKTVKSPLSPKKAVKSPSPKKTRSAKSAESESEMEVDSPLDLSFKSTVKSRKNSKKTVKSPLSPKKAAKSPSPKKTRSAKSAKSGSTEKSIESPVSVKKTVKSGKSPKKALKSPASPKKAKSPLSPKKAVKSPSPKRMLSEQASSSQKRSTVSKRKAEHEDMKKMDAFETSGTDQPVVMKSQKRKRGSEVHLLEDSPKQKSAKLIHTPRRTPQKKSTPKTKSGGSKSTSAKAKSKRKSATRKDAALSTPLSSRGVAALGSSDLDEKTPSKKGEEKVKNIKQKKTPTPAKKGKGKKSPASKSPAKKMNESSSTPKSALKSKKKSPKSSTKKSASAVLVRSAGRKSTTGKLDVSDSLSGSYLQVSDHQAKQSSHESSLSKKKTSKRDSVARSTEDEKILEILKKAAHSTPKSAKKITTPKSAKGSKKPAVKRLQNDHKSSATTKETRRSLKSAGSLVTVGSTPRIVISEAGPQSISLETSLRKTLETAEDRLSRRSYLTPLTHQSAKASSSGIRSADILSRGLSSSTSITSHRQEGRDADHLAVEEFDGRSGAVAQTSLQGQAYQEEKSFAQYVEYRGNSRVERYGTQAVERSVGEQKYRSASYRIQRKKGQLTEVDQEEHWEEGDTNNGASAVSMQVTAKHEEDQWEEEDDVDYSTGPDDANTSTISTSTHSTRCIIL